MVSHPHLQQITFHESLCAGAASSAGEGWRTGALSRKKGVRTNDGRDLAGTKKRDLAVALTRFEVVELNGIEPMTY